MPAKSLPGQPSLTHLRYQAKDLLAAVNQNHPEAIERVREYHPKFRAHDTGTLRDFSLADAQLVIAREYGFESWPKLRRHVTSTTKAPASETPSPGAITKSHAERVAMFLENACPDHHVRGGADHLMAEETALRLLRQHPEIVRENIYAAVVCGELDEVKRILTSDREAARRKNPVEPKERPGVGNSFDRLQKDVGGQDWEPVLFLCFTRLSTDAVKQNSVTIARLLLEHGANPNAYFMAGGSRYTPLVGVIGEGEECRPPHPQRDALAKLLLDGGAEPYDIQVVYNIGFQGKVLWFLKLIHARSIELGRSADWADPEWSMLGMGGYGSGARWHLGIAVTNNDLPLARWALEHGASPNTAPAKDPHLPQRSLYEAAVAAGFEEMANLLLAHGATRIDPPADDLPAFRAACLRCDRESVESLLQKHPEYLQAPEVMFHAVSQDLPEVVAVLLEVGFSPNLKDSKNGRQQPLHAASSVKVIEMLIKAGAEVDYREQNYQATALGFAIWGQNFPKIEILSTFSKDVWGLTTAGKVERLRAIFSTEPELARTGSDAQTPLMWLPANESVALEIAELFLSLGADPTIKNKDGVTAAELARRRGQDRVAARLEAAANGEAGRDIPADKEGLEALAKDLANAFESDDAGALQRVNRFRRRTASRDDLRAEVWHRVYKVRQAQGRPGCFTVSDAREFLANEAGHSNWGAFVKAGGAPSADEPFAIDGRRISPRRRLSDHDWDRLIAVMKERRLTELESGGYITDSALKKIAQLDQVTRLNLGGAQELTDEGLKALAALTQLEALDLSNYPGSSISDEGLEVLRHLHALKRFKICWQPGISDKGIANLSWCEQLESVNLMGTHTGDEALKSLRGKATLREVMTGRLVTDHGLAYLTEFPFFEKWQGAEIDYDKLPSDAKPSNLLLDGPFTDQGLQQLAGLAGVFELSFFWHTSRMTSAGLKVLPKLPMLGSVGCDGKLCDDEAMKHLAEVPRLRRLMIQGTVATDDGFEALSRSRTVSHIWGRDSHNLAGRGFAALSKMPSLRNLAVSCKNVDDTSLALLPEFPALRELTPIDVADPGFKYVGQCIKLEKLTCMYCRETTDAATACIAALSRLKSYYAGLTKITDRSLEIIGRIKSLEAIEFYECREITDAGLSFLARLPRLRKAEFYGNPNVTLAGTKAFPNQVKVKYSC
jgi:hypothetical protein